MGKVVKSGDLVICIVDTYPNLTLNKHYEVISTNYHKTDSICIFDDNGKISDNNTFILKCASEYRNVTIDNILT